MNKLAAVGLMNKQVAICLKENKQVSFGLATKQNTFSMG